MTLFDVLTKETVRDVSSIEEAAQIVGSIMSFFGQNFTQNRYIVYDTPSRKGVANVLAGPGEMHKRGRAYYRKR